jgi:hypothetical protein
MACVGVLSPGHPLPGDAFHQRERFEAGRRNLGWTPGLTILIDYRYAEGQLERLAALGRLGDTPWRLRMSQTVERAGQGQRGWRVLRIDTSFLAPQDGCRCRASRIVTTTWSGVWRGEVLGLRERSSRPCGRG